MSARVEHDLKPLINKLSRQSPLGNSEVAALQGLPYEIVELSRNSYIIREGDKPGYCAAVLNGFVYRSKLTGEGTRQILSVHLQGDLVCGHDQLLGEADHSIQALTVVKLAYIPQRAILELAATHPAIAQAVWRDTLVDASRYREWILNVGRRNARQRLSHLLCELVLRQEAAGISTDKDYSLPITQEQLADALGLTPIHVNRTIQSLRRDKLIETSSHRLIIREWQALKVEGDFRPDYLHLAGNYEARSVRSRKPGPLRKLAASVAY